MMSRVLFFLALVVMSAQAFAPRPLFLTKPVAASATMLESCRTHAKKEKIKRNRENMRKFRTGGKKGTSRRKILKKAEASLQRQIEAEFISKCFITVPAPNMDNDSK